MDNPVTPENQNALIEDAFQTYPMASMPRDITAEVLRRIQNVPAPRSFRLAWSDLVISLVLSLCVGAVWFSLDHLPPLVMANIHKESILFYQHLLVNAHWLIPAIFFGLAAFLSALTIPYLKQELMKEST